MSNQSDEREILPYSSPRPDYLAKTQQAHAERHSIEQDMCPISYRSKGSDDVGLSFKNNSMCIKHKQISEVFSLWPLAKHVGISIL